MVRIEKYEKAMEEKYWECVKEIIPDAIQDDIVSSCKKFMPPDFFGRNEGFKELVLAPFEKIQKAYQDIKESEMNLECFTKEGNKIEPYNTLYKAYKQISKRMVDGMKLNVMLIRETGLTVCPYCNREYINCRSKKAAGAQLDHFYPRSKYPVFSVCLYNLVPVCGNCNRLKSRHVMRLASPFDENIDWDNNIRFSYELVDLNKKRITITAKESVKQNIDTMCIEEAYQIHDVEVDELLNKFQMYSRTQFEEFKHILSQAEMTESEMKQMVFGTRITEGDMKKKPLGRMFRDLERELGIYT